jgi:hypothetical protein
MKFCAAITQEEDTLGAAGGVCELILQSGIHKPMYLCVYTAVTPRRRTTSAAARWLCGCVIGIGRGVIGRDQELERTAGLRCWRAILDCIG